MKIGVIGLGYVGLGVVSSFLTFKHDVTAIDIDEEKIKHLKNGILPISEPHILEVLNENKDRVIYSHDYSLLKGCEAVFVCVNTPENKDWSVNLDAINKCVDDVLNNVDKGTLIIIKSTVLVGYTSMVAKKAKEAGMYVVFMPEFLRQGHAYQDSINPSRIVIGVEDDKALEIVNKLYSSFDCPKVVTNFASAELAKYASNNFLATKISFINQIANFSNVVGANIQDVKDIMELDPRIGKGSLNPGVGFGGGCFVKDTKALYKQSEDLGSPITIVKETINQNEKQKYILLNELSNSFNGLEYLKDNKILIVGVSFKANSADLRNSIALDNIKVLERFTDKFALYDPLLGKEDKKRLPYKFEDNLENAIKLYDILLIFTEREEINDLSQDLFKDKIVLDGRNVLSDERALKCKHYFSIGRGDLKKI